MSPPSSPADLEDTYTELPPEALQETGGGSDRNRFLNYDSSGESKGLSTLFQDHAPLSLQATHNEQTKNEYKHGVNKDTRAWE